MIARAELVADGGESAGGPEFFRSRPFLDAEGVSHTLRIETAAGTLVAPLLVRQIGDGPERDAISPYGYPGLVESEGDRGHVRRSLPAVAPTGLPRISLTAAAILSRHLDRWLDADTSAVLTEWRQRDVLRGREVSWDGGSGVADGVDDRGYLVVVTPGGRVAVGAGEVHLGRIG